MWMDNQFYIDEIRKRGCLISLSSASLFKFFASNNIKEGEYCNLRTIF